MEKTEKNIHNNACNTQFQNIFEIQVFLDYKQSILCNSWVF